MTDTETNQTEQQRFSIILEDEPIWTKTAGGVRRPLRPIARQLDIIDAKDLDDAWVKAKNKWNLVTPRVQIVDIISGELTEPLRPGERPIRPITPEEAAAVKLPPASEPAEPLPGRPLYFRQ
jgi:hypothetical protein